MEEFVLKFQNFLEQKEKEWVLCWETKKFLNEFLETQKELEEKIYFNS